MSKKQGVYGRNELIYNFSLFFCSKQGGSVEETMVLIHDLQRPLLLSKQSGSQAYRALDAVSAM